MRQVFTFFVLICFAFTLRAFQLISQEADLAKIVVIENGGVRRISEFIELSLQISEKNNRDLSSQIIAVDETSNRKISCQKIDQKYFPKQKVHLITIIFPVDVDSLKRKIIRIQSGEISEPISSDLSFRGEGLELIIENEFYRADLTKSFQSEAKSHDSGQLRELFIKMGFNQLLYRTENRMHWAPNFKKEELEYYTTIAGWDMPAFYRFYHGPYVIQTIRQDAAPDHPEILLTASYEFYAGKPYFKFYSCMEMLKDVWLELLRNDEMTMDSLFTHVAFQRSNGEIVDLLFSERYAILDEQPISNDAPWLCFYHSEKRYAFGSIRLKYDNTSIFGEPSPTFLPHTKISDGANGGKYWNRRLIHDQLTFVPKGSRYVEENAYLVFQVNDADRFQTIKHWANRLRNPLRIEVIQGDY